MRAAQAKQITLALLSPCAAEFLSVICQDRLPSSRNHGKIQADKKALAEEEKQALKAHKKDAIAEVKKLIVEYKLTKGDIRGKAIKQLMGE